MKRRRKVPVFTDDRHCTHCGGIMRYYRGSYSCLMCGREADHHCEDCTYAENQYIKKPA